MIAGGAAVRGARQGPARRDPHDLLGSALRRVRQFYYAPAASDQGGPLILIAIGLSLGFRAGIWNIGAEGQYIMGAIFGAAVGLAFYPPRRWSSSR
jgi:ABC-type uncharacterized transport system permease subunit